MPSDLSSFRELKTEDLKQVLQWRNNPEVRKYFFNSHEISWDEHYAWWQSYKKDASKKWLIYELDNKLCGVVYFDKIIHGQSAYWGFYFADSLDAEQVLKTWLKLEKQAIAYAFEQLGIAILKCEVFDFNRSVHLMHKRFGFKAVDSYQHAKGMVNVYQLAKSS